MCAHVVTTAPLEQNQLHRTRVQSALSATELGLQQLASATHVLLVTIVPVQLQSRSAHSVVSAISAQDGPPLMPRQMALLATSAPVGTSALSEQVCHSGASEGHTAVHWEIVRNLTAPAAHTASSVATVLCLPLLVHAMLGLSASGGRTHPSHCTH